MHFTTLKAAKNSVAKSLPHHFTQLLSGMWQATLGMPCNNPDLAFMGIEVVQGRALNVWHHRVADAHRYAAHLEICRLAALPCPTPKEEVEV